MMSGRAVGCSLADAFSGPTTTPTVATYQSRLATAQAQTTAHARQTQYAPAPLPAPVFTPAQASTMATEADSTTSSSDTDSDDEEAYRRFVRSERRKRRDRKLSLKLRRRRRPVETDTETDTETDVDTDLNSNTATAIAVASESSSQIQNRNIVVAQGSAFPIASAYVRQNVGQASFAGALPAQGFSVAAASMGPPGSCVPQNPLGVDFGTGSNMYATGYPNNGMPQTVLDGRFDTIRSDRRDLAGTFVDPITGIAYAGFTDSMPEPKVMREPPTIKLGEPSRMLEALTGVPSYKRPLRQEVLNDFSDVLEGVQIPQGLIELQVRDNAAQRVAADTFFTNNETENGFNDTHWDGFIGDTYVLRPVIDTQTLSDNSQSNTVVAPFRSMPDVYSSTFQINDGTEWGGPLQPSVTVLSRDKATLPGRGSVDMPSLGQHVRLPGIPTQMSFSDDAPTSHSNTPFMTQYGGGGGGAAASLAVVGTSSYDATRVSVASKPPDMPYALYNPVVALSTAGSANDEVVPTVAVYGDVGAGMGTGNANTNTAQRFVTTQDGLGTAAGDTMHVRASGTSMQTQETQGLAAGTNSVRAQSDNFVALQRTAPSGTNGARLGQYAGEQSRVDDSSIAANAVNPSAAAMYSWEAAGAIIAAPSQGFAHDSSARADRAVPFSGTPGYALPYSVIPAGHGDTATANDAAASTARITAASATPHDFNTAGLQASGGDGKGVSDAAAAWQRTAPASTAGRATTPHVETSWVTDSAASNRVGAVQDFHDARAFMATSSLSKINDGTAAVARTQPNGQAADMTPWSLVASTTSQGRDAGVQSARRSAVADQEFPYAVVGMAVVAPERSSGVDAVLAPALHRAASDGSYNTARADVTSVASMVGAIEKASRRMASVSTDVDFRSAEASISAAPGHDAMSALSYNTYGGGAVWKTAPDVLPSVYEVANVSDDSPGALRVDVVMNSTGNRLQTSQPSDLGKDAVVALSSGAATAAATSTFQMSGVRLPGVRQDDMGVDTYASTRQANTYDTTSGRDATLTWAWDGQGQRFDDVPRPASMNATASYETASINIGQASDRPAQLKAGSENTPRVANDMTLFATGQSMLPTDTLPSMPSQKDTGRDATKESDVHVGHTSLLRDAFLAAHPSTYGKAAEYRNVYRTTTRAGIVVENLETQRAAGHPGRAAQNDALARQQSRNEEVRRQEIRSGNAMNAVRVAYESDAYASDA